MQGKKSIAVNNKILHPIQKHRVIFKERLAATGIAVLIFFGTGSFIRPGVNTELVIQFRVYVNGQPFVMNKQYRNPFGETYEISRFRFYAGRFAPVYSDNSFRANATRTYHLVDFSDSSTTQIRIDAPEGACNGVEFMIGIDSVDQVRGAQTGDLDPGKGMFWTWNSGYLSFKIEGTSLMSNQPAHVMAYHIGGYRQAFNTVWRVKLYSTNDASFMLSKKTRTVVEIGIDLDYFFDGTTPLHIRETPSCTTVGELARKLSGNFIGSFTELQVISRP